MLYKVALNTVSVNKKTLSVTIQMKATGQYFPVVLFLTLYEGVLIAIQTKSTEQYFPVVLLIMLYTVVLIAIHMKATELYFPVVLFTMQLQGGFYRQSNESYWAVLSWGTVYYAVTGGSNFKSIKV